MHVAVKANKSDEKSKKKRKKRREEGVKKSILNKNTSGERKGAPVEKKLRLVRVVVHEARRGNGNGEEVIARDVKRKKK